MFGAASPSAPFARPAMLAGLDRRLLVKIFAISFLCACLLQGSRWALLGSQDDFNWSNEARFVQEDDARQFELSNMYGYPGRPVIDGTRFLHTLLGVSYPTALVTFMTLADACLIAGITTIIYALRQDALWAVAAGGMLAVNPLYVHASAPSAVATLLLVFLCLLTLAIDERRGHASPALYVAWSLSLGITVAIRADIGGFSGGFFALILLATSNWKTMLMVLGGAIGVFVLCDPYMYWMPVRHVRDLVGKVTFHYAEIAPARLTGGQLWGVSSLLIFSLGLGWASVATHRGNERTVSARFLLFLAAFTACSYAVFLTARYQTERYYLPIVFIWQTFLPLFLLTLAPVIPFSFLKTPEEKERARRIYRWSVPGVLVGCNLAYFAWTLVLERVFPVR